VHVAATPHDVLAGPISRAIRTGTPLAIRALITTEVSFMKPAALAALIGFGALNVYAVVSAGLAGLGTAVVGVNAWSAVLVTDLAIALAMVCVWVYRDAKRRGKSPAPYIALTLATGSIGPLLYLLVRDDERIG
jgi:hypothetical protein